MFSKYLNLWILLEFVSIGPVADLLPIPSFEPDLAQVAYLRRSLALLQSSSPSNRPDFRILIYGQSFSMGAWTEILVADCQARYPNVNFVVTNKAVGGFSAGPLSYAANADVGPWQPDLVLLNCLGDHLYDYEGLYNVIKTTCTADVIVHSDHPTSDSQVNESLDISEVTPDTIWVLRNYHWLPEMANRYGFCWADLRTPWKSYLISNQLPFNNLLGPDNSHFNDDGHQLQAKLLSTFFAPRTFVPPSDPWNYSRIQTRPIGSDIRWSGDSLDLTIHGNRVDVIYESQPPPDSPAYGYTLDDREPSKVKELFDFDKSSSPWAISGVLFDRWPSIWPGVMDIASQALLQEETWTLKTEKIDYSTGEVLYNITGSSTGFDGSGSSLRPFVSNSMRVTIERGMVIIWFAYSLTQQKPPDDWEIHFDSVRRSVDTFKPVPSPSPAVESVQTLFLSSSDSAHNLKIRSLSGAPKGIRAIRVYSPSGAASVSDNTPPTVVGPTLTIKRLGSSLTISWPKEWGRGTVESTSALQALRKWTVIGDPITQSGVRFQITKPAADSVGFYRWRKTTN